MTAAIAFEALGFNPAPGVVEEVDRLAARYRRISAKLRGALDTLNTIADQRGVWEGEAAEAFGSNIDRLPEYLGKAVDSTSGASDALDEWATSLRALQHRAVELELRARKARDAAEEAIKDPAFELANRTYYEPDALAAAQRMLDAAADRLNGALENLTAIQETAERLLDEHGELAENIAHRLDEARELAPDKPGGIGNAIGGAISGAIGGAVDLASDVAGGARDLASGAVGVAADVAGDAVGVAADVAGEAVGLVADVAGGAVGVAADVAGGAVGLASDVAGGAVDVAAGAVSGVAGLASDVAGGAAHLASGTISGAIDLTSDAVEGAGNLVEDGAEMVADTSRVVGDLSGVVGMAADLPIPGVSESLSVVAAGMDAVALGGLAVADEIGADVPDSDIAQAGRGLTASTLGVLPGVPSTMADGAAPDVGQYLVPRSGRQWADVGSSALFPDPPGAE